MRIVINLDESDFEHIEVPKPGHRKMLLYEAQKLAKLPSSSSGVKPPPSPSVPQTPHTLPPPSVQGLALQSQQQQRPAIIAPLPTSPLPISPTSSLPQTLTPQRQPSPMPPLSRPAPSNTLQHVITPQTQPVPLATQHQPTRSQQPSPPQQPPLTPKREPQPVPSTSALPVPQPPRHPSPTPPTTALPRVPSSPASQLQQQTSPQYARILLGRLDLLGLES